MGRHSLNEAEQGFFGALLGNEGHHKVAVDLDSDVASALGIETVSPGILDQLENQAGSMGGEDSADGDEPNEQESVEPADSPIEESPAEELDGFDRNDSEPDEGTEAAPAPPLPSRATHGKLFCDKRAHPLQILEVLTMRYGTEWADWESDTLWWALRKSFGPVGEVARNKIMALRLAATSDMAWIDWDVFEDSGLSWNDIVPTIGAFQPMTPMQTAFAISILRGIRPGDRFANEVKAYIAAILDEHGWVYAPEEWFDGAGEILDKGRDHLIGLRSEISDAWEKVRGADPSTVEWNEEDPRDIHVLKMFVVQRYLKEREGLRQAVPGAPSGSSSASPPVP